METSHEADFDPREGAHKLLVNCLKLKAGDHLVIVTEEPGENFYDSDGPSCVAAEAQRLDCQFTEVSLPLVRNPAELPAEARSLIAEASHLVFFSRLGDQVRFTDLPGSGTKTMCYALDIGFLGSPFCRLPHGFMEDLVTAFGEATATSRRWHMTCAKGTDLSGEILSMGNGGTDFTLKLFPLSIFPPILCSNASGRLVFGHWLMAAGNSLYESPDLVLDDFLAAEIENGRILGFDGPKNQVRMVYDHFERVGRELDIDPYVFHSWHSGMHPKAYYPHPAKMNIERWGTVAFANPRYTHFHSCGDYAPGEIALSLFDASIAFDDQLYWDRGDFSFLKTSRIAALAAEHGLGLDDLKMNREIGLE